MRVGLLEDDVSILEVLSLILQDEGYQVIAFPTAEACLKALNAASQHNEARPVDVLIADWRLNGTISGTEVIRQIRQQPYLSTLPIILTTAATFNDFDELQRLDVALLEKPFAVDDVIALVKQLTQQNPPHTAELQS